MFTIVHITPAQHFLNIPIMTKIQQVGLRISHNLHAKDLFCINQIFHLKLDTKLSFDISNLIFISSYKQHTINIKKKIYKRSITNFFLK